MSLFVRTRPCLRTTPILATTVRTHWNKDFKPGPYPRTEDERLKAAEKYNLDPSEYKTFPDDGSGFGDYPKLPDIGMHSRDPYYPWDNPELKRNFDEPLHSNFGMLREDRYDLGVKMRYPLWLQVVQCAGAMLGLFVAFHILENFKMFHAATPRQYPNDGKDHFTFEPEDE